MFALVQVVFAEGFSRRSAEVQACARLRACAVSHGLYTRPLLGSRIVFSLSFVDNAVSVVLSNVLFTAFRSHGGCRRVFIHVCVHIYVYV